MRNLTAERPCVVAKLSDMGHSSLPLQEQMRPLINAAPYLVLDVDGVQFTSMMLGEIVNVYMAFQEKWHSQAHGIAMIHPLEVTKQAFRVAKLSDKIPVYDDFDAAWRAFGISTRTAARA